MSLSLFVKRRLILIIWIIVNDSSYGSFTGESQRSPGFDVAPRQLAGAHPFSYTSNGQRARPLRDTLLGVMLG
jgi:hypothetical protein